MNRIYGSNEIHQINLNKFFYAMFMLYTVTVYCFNASEENIQYIHITWAGVIAIVALKMIFNIKSFKFFKEIIILILYAIYCRASSLWAVWSPTMAESRATTVLQMVLFTVLSIYYLTQIKDVKIIIWSLIIAGVVLSLYIPLNYGGFAEYYQQASTESVRMGGEIDNENAIGISCAFTVVLLFFAGMYYKKWWLYLFTILPFIVSMSSGSRTGLVIVFIGICLLLFLSQDNINGSAIKWFKLIIIGIMALFAIWLILKLPIMESINERMEDLFKTLSGKKGDNSSKVRIEMFKIGWQQFKKAPFFGIGLSNSYYVNKYATGLFTYLHNDFIEQLVNLGIVGFGLYYGLLLSLLISHIKLLKTRKPEVIISFVMLVCFLVSSYGTVWYYYKQTYILMALWVSVVINNRTERGIVE